MQRDINDYANELLVSFLDAFHIELKAGLDQEYGDQWLEQGVRRHFRADYFDRARQMLESPMRVVDMGKTDEEMYGVEHLWSIVDGNWARVFQARFRDKARTQVYLSEIAEVRHNLSHRRGRHHLTRGELMRFVQDCAVLLGCIGSPKARDFEHMAESLSAGAAPWGAAIGGYLPPQDEVVDEFVGRQGQLRDLASWLGGDSPQLLVWGYGGAGKSAIAYQFARDTREAPPSGINAVAWVGAKRREYIGGAERPRQPDFTDKPSLVGAIFKAVYEVDVSSEDLTSDDLLEHLRDTPVLLVVDDFDTVLEDDELVEFLMYEVRGTGSRVLYTSRQKVAGLRSVEVLGFDGKELEDFVTVRAYEHGLDPGQCVKRLKGIHSVTSGYPLFVDDLLRYARIVGVDASLSDWGQRKGDAAREYALRRQLQQLGTLAKDTLLGLSIAGRPLSTLELASLCGVTDDDAELAVRSLLDWRLVSLAADDGSNRPAFAANLNTQRLVLRTYGNEPRVAGMQLKAKTLNSGRIPAARANAIALAIGTARSLVLRGDVGAAVEELQGRMTGELADSPDLLGALGWVYSRHPKKYVHLARETFERAAELGNTKEDTFYHWASMERRLAEDAVGSEPPEAQLDAWRRCINAAELGVKTCGSTRALCWLAGYAHGREAKTLERLNEFVQAQGAYGESIVWMRKAMSAPASSVTEVSRGAMFRGLALAQEGAGETDALKETLKDWAQVVGDDSATRWEYERLCCLFPPAEGGDMAPSESSC